MNDVQRLRVRHEDVFDKWRRLHADVLSKAPDEFEPYIDAMTEMRAVVREFDEAHVGLPLAVRPTVVDVMTELLRAASVTGDLVIAMMKEANSALQEKRSPEWRLVEASYYTYVRRKYGSDLEWEDVVQNHQIEVAEKQFNQLASAIDEYRYSYG